MNLKDCAAGMLFVAIGLLFAVNAWLGLSIGSAFAMGPGYFPILLGVILIGFGAGDRPCPGCASRRSPSARCRGAASAS